MRILIAEDDATSQLILLRFLRSYGRCDAVEDGAQAVEAFQKALVEEDPYTLVLMDIRMPGMNGHRALQRIRSLEASQGITECGAVKAIMVTALEDPSNVLEAFYEGGADAYLVKPLNKDRLDAELQMLGLI
jgi:two-component system chemotaxis response regulator CheY